MYQEVGRLLAEDIITKSYSEWSAPIVAWIFGC